MLVCGENRSLSSSSSSVSASGNCKNTVCKEKNWPTSIFGMLKRLLVLDGRDSQGRVSSWREPNYLKIAHKSHNDKENQYVASRNQPAQLLQDPTWKKAVSSIIKEKDAEEEEQEQFKQQQPNDEDNGNRNDEKLCNIETQLEQLSSLMRTFRSEPMVIPSSSNISRESISRLAFDREKDIMDERIRKLEDQLAASISTASTSTVDLVKPKDESNHRVNVEDLVARMDDERIKYQLKESNLVERLKKATIELTNCKAKISDLERSQQEMQNKASATFKYVLFDFLLITKLDW